MIFDECYNIFPIYQCLSMMDAAVDSR
jgi:hypothetical protein